MGGAAVNEEAISLVTRERVMMTIAGGLALLVPMWLLSGSSEAPEGAPAIGITPFKAATVEQPADALAAPLFNADRETPPIDDPDGNTTQTAAETPAAAVPSLVGLIVGRGMPGLALARGADGQTHLLHVGDTLDGWQVAAISTTGATFDLNGHSEKVGLNFAKAASGLPSAGSPSPANPPPDTGQSKPPEPGQPLPSGTDK
jgi:hypothetical protein